MYREISAILLAAGQSQRMSDENKLIRNFNGSALIKHSVKNILDSCVDELIIVLGYEHKIIEKLINKDKKIKIVFNKNFNSGMASSIKTGIKYLSDKTESFFICLGDMPMINKKIYNKLIECKDLKEIIVPTLNGNRGNPVLFSRSMKEKIVTIKGDVGAKKIIEMNEDKVFALEINDDCITRDFNTNEDFTL